MRSVGNADNDIISAIVAQYHVTKEYVQKLMSPQKA